jgi:hypothetical protein
MKYLKTYELYSTGQIIDYGIGDIVVCVDDHAKMSMRMPLVKGDKYEVLRIYTMPEDRFLGNKFSRVEVEDIKTGQVTRGWESTRFKIEMEFDVDKYNL